MPPGSLYLWGNKRHYASTSTRCGQLFNKAGQHDVCRCRQHVYMHMDQTQLALYVARARARSLSPDRQTERDRQRDRQRERHRQTYRERDRERQRERKRKREREKRRYGHDPDPALDFLNAVPCHHCSDVCANHLSPILHLFRRAYTNAIVHCRPVRSRRDCCRSGHPAWGVAQLNPRLSQNKQTNVSAHACRKG